MLKGFFYRRTSENNPFETNTQLRFEINSKESVLAKISNLSQEGLQFLLPRGKVILVPDERILLVLNSPEHGEFKIQCDVYYFCNICDQNNSQLVCYGVKFYELSSSTWDILQEFCGAKLPEITFLNNPFNQPVISQNKPAPTVAVSAPKEAVSEIPTTSFIPFTPIVPAETPAVAPVATPTINAMGKTDPIAKAFETTPPFSEIPSQSGAFSIPAAINEAASGAFLNSVESLASLSAIAPKTKEKSPAKSNSNPLLSAAVFSPVEPATEREPEQKQTAIKTAPTAATVAPALEEPIISPQSSNQNAEATVTITAASKNGTAKQSKQSSIQVLAASLASPAKIHTQQKAQSLSQEMIDRLIEKLEAEAKEGQQDDSPQATQPDSTPAYNPIPDYLRVPDMNPAYQAFKDSAVVGKSAPKQPEGFNQPEAQTSQPAPFAENIGDTASFNPFTSFDFKPEVTKQPETQTSQSTPFTENVGDTASFNPFAFKPETAKKTVRAPRPAPFSENIAAETTPFDPFTALNSKFDSIQQPEDQNGKSSSITENGATAATPFDPFASFKFSSATSKQSDALTNQPLQSGQLTPSGIDSNNSLFADAKPSNQTDLPKNAPMSSNTAAVGFEGNSLLDLVNNLDTTINKNSPSTSDKPIATAAGRADFPAMAPETPATIAPEEPNKTELPYFGKESSQNKPTSGKKTVVPGMGDISPVPRTMASESSSNTTPLSEPPATAADLKPSPVGSTIIPNSSGVSLDQKAIDKLVSSLLQNMPPDEPAPAPEQPNEPNPVLQPNVTMGKSATDSKVNPKIQPEITPFNNSAMGRNIFTPDPNNNRVMDQKSIDVIVKTLTEGSPNPVMAESGQSAPTPNAVPLKTAPASGTKRTLDQKAIDQVVQALTQNYPNNGKLNPNKPTGFAKPDQSATVSLASLHASIQLERGGVLQAAIEQIYVGGLMVAVDQEIPLNSHLRLNLFGDNLRISELTGTCTNCEPNPSGKTGYLAEIFFKNMSTVHMEQFRTLIAKLDVNH